MHFHKTRIDASSLDRRHLGPPEIPDTIGGLKAKLVALNTLPTEIGTFENQRDGLAREILQAKAELLRHYRDLYRPVQAFIDSHRVYDEAGGLQFEASATAVEFPSRFLGKIHHGRRGSFMGEDDGRARVYELLASADMSIEEDAIAFVHQMMDHLRTDYRDEVPRSAQVADQLRQGVTPADMYDFLYSFDYLQPRYELRWQGKRLNQLSAGERGNLLLVFYLLIDKRDTPLIIDQPEENLDNQTISGMVVPSIAEAKQRRQIVMVTHNPNLAVVCDADQVIHARIDKTDGNRVIYTMGALENPEITQLILDVLEGTKPAFDKRDAKYELLERAGA